MCSNPGVRYYLFMHDLLHMPGLSECTLRCLTQEHSTETLSRLKCGHLNPRSNVLHCIQKHCGIEFCLGMQIRQYLLWKQNVSEKK